MKLTAEQIQENWKTFLSYIDSYISQPRANELTVFYNKYAERIMMMPASHKKEYHNAFPGGYVEHVNRVIKAALKINDVWEEFGVDKNYTVEELVFSAMNHDLGKMGDEENESYIPQTDQWRRDKLGEFYTINPLLGNSLSHSQRSIRILSQFNIEMSEDEHLAILHHAMLNCEENKYISFSKNKMLRITNIADSWSAFVDEV